jgi:large subunit ribosomal protein L21
VDGARVLCEVVEHRLGPKTIAFRYRRRENWRRTVGHRQRLTRLLVKDLQIPGVMTAPAKAAEPVVAAAPATRLAKQPRTAKAPAAPRPVAKKAPVKPKTKPTKASAHGA